MFLAKVTDGNNNSRSKALTEKRPPAKYFYKNFKYKIVERKIKYKRKAVSKKLYPSPQIRINKNHIPH